MLWFPPNCKCHTVTVSETESECDNVKKRLQPQAGPGGLRPGSLSLAALVSCQCPGSCSVTATRGN
jgi:uncharacterized OsmC-like protein